MASKRSKDPEPSQGKPERSSKLLDKAETSQEPLGKYDITPEERRILLSVTSGNDLTISLMPRTRSMRSQAAGGVRKKPLELEPS